MIALALAFAGAIAQCAPNVGPRTMAAIVQVESGGDPLAIGDNTTGRSYHARDRVSAEALAQRLVDAGHSVDLGIAQIDNMNLRRLGLRLSDVFNPCINLGAGANILAADYKIAARHFGPGQRALRHAIGMYNTGRLNSGEGYVNRVLAAAGIPTTIAVQRPGEAAAGVVRQKRRKAEMAPILVRPVSQVVLM